MTALVSSPPPMHHPAEDVLLRHAAGTLPAGHALVVAVHLRFCQACRDAVRVAEAVGGAILAEMPGANLSAGALEQVLARLDAPETDVPGTDVPGTGAPGTGAPGFGALGTGVVDADTGPGWTDAPPVRFEGVALPAALGVLARPRWRWTGPGVSRMALTLPGAAAGERTWLLRAMPHRGLPGHGHNGWEATCVLAGAFSDRHGRFGRGDMVELDETHLHRPIAGPGEPCICLIAWDGPLNPRRSIPRLFQRFNGM